MHRVWEIVGPRPCSVLCLKLRDSSDPTERDFSGNGVTRWDEKAGLRGMH